MTDRPLLPPDCWHRPDRQPGPGPCAQCLVILQRQLQALEEQERIEQRHLRQFREEPKPNRGHGPAGAVKTRQLNQSRRDLERTLAETARQVAEQADSFRQEAEYWKALAALPHDPEAWRNSSGTESSPR